MLPSIQEGSLSTIDWSENPAAGHSLNAMMTTMNTVNTAFLSPSSSFVSARGGAEPGQIGGGVWARTVVGSLESKSTTTGTIDTSQAKAGTSNGNIEFSNRVAPVTGTGTCEGTLKETYIGHQFGVDLAKLNIEGGAAICISASLAAISLM
jgi:hypothetical protein